MTTGPVRRPAALVVTDTALDSARWPLGSRGHSEWTFRSAATAEDHWSCLPLISLAYDIETDLAGSVRGGQRIPVGLGASYVAQAAGTGTLSGGRLEVSYDDGGTWTSVPLKGAGASWHGTLTVPRGASSVSLRASAHDDKGGAVDAGDHPGGGGEVTYGWGWCAIPLITPSSTRSCGRIRNCSAVASTSSSRRLSMAAASSGAITEK